MKCMRYGTTYDIDYAHRETITSTSSGNNKSQY